MKIGTTLFLIAIHLLRDRLSGFRKLLLACAAIIAGAILIAIANHYDETSRQNASYQPTTYEVPAHAPVPKNELLNSILHGPSSYPTSPNNEPVHSPYRDAA